MNHHDALTLLRDKRTEGAIPDKDVTFVCSLLDNYEKRNALSQKQWDWVVRLAAKYTQPNEITVGSFAGVYQLIFQARAHLRYPKIRLVIRNDDIDYPVALSMSGPKSKYPDTINVTDGAPYGENIWYGRIYPDGKFDFSAKAESSPVFSQVVALLARLAEQPEKVAGDHGKLTGHCCFCNRSLEDKRSTDVGYGPICAEHFNLPWG